MNKNTIEYLAYLLDEARNQEGKEKAIVFLGAGVSVSAGIPLTGTIVEDIKEKFGNNPIIKECINNKNDDYYSLMGALTADERRDLFHFYVTRDEVKLNLANIYLAQLLKLGYVDYIVTVNFDDLILKACTLFNFLPPVYDISNIKTITTTDIRKGSVIYLHGQYFGQWLLNNPDELKKVEDEVLQLFNAIKTRRTWIVVGYSGNDGIFEKIKSLGSFSSELFWIKNKFSEGDETVIEFIETPNINAHKIEGYYADSFFLKLHAELSKLNKNLEAPEIISRPFTFVKSVLQSINEIKEDDELNDNVKKMVISCNERIDKAIAEYEDEETEENLKQRILDAILKEDFSEEMALSFENEAKQKNYKNVSELSSYYNDWGVYLLRLARQQNDEGLFKESIEKYKKASELNPKDVYVYNNWGNALLGLAGKRNDEGLFKESIEKYKKASRLDPKNSSVFYNWGNVLFGLSNNNNDEILLKESIEKYKKASELDPKNSSIFNIWGMALQNLARNENNEILFTESIERFKKASELDSKNASIFYNWGVGLSGLAKLKNSEDLFRESLEKYKKSSELDPKNPRTFYNWGYSLIRLGQLLSDDKYLRKALEITQKGYELGGNPYNMSCIYALLNDKENALKYLKETLDSNFITLEEIYKDDDWNIFKSDNDFLNLINQYKIKHKP
ncbi:tetratricopeptide repeat protein [Chryseobacterium sp. ES2]|uniref:Tetratricopeptide repeat protein n=1 Tax=Chryseobacterium metallicongregator TaxID=3073042 RepID=A0ABU1EC09_9FLAO|nr:tetratricopeptide repeat protein [Chryseobacterium sp. ES2]MDR4955141.1 tetratricopeptide repeat protein [Chryseobacterium sp. ES2]